MKISIFAGDLCDAKADALCTSTNPRLSLAMGTGGSVRDRGGYQILRECEAIVEAELLRSGLRGLPSGSVHVTGAGDLPSRVIVHCVASDESHRSSEVIIRNCVTGALARADEAECESIAMPVFAAGHAGFRFESALTAMAGALHESFSAAMSFHATNSPAAVTSEGLWSCHWIGPNVLRQKTHGLPRYQCSS